MGSLLRKQKTYAEALEELGGVPWRALEGTEQWFLIEEEPRKKEPDTDAFRIPRASNRVWIALAAALLSGGLFALLVVPAAAPTRLAIAAPAAQIVFMTPPPAPVATLAAVTLPPAAAVTAAPLPVHPRVFRRHFKHRKRR